MWDLAKSIEHGERQLAADSGQKKFCLQNYCCKLLADSLS
jgi:hypothetical protein